MITLTNYSSGELLVNDDTGHSLRLSQEAANRLILHARMHTVVEFAQGLPGLISDPALVQAITTFFESAKTSSERWNLKEKFARLQTLTKGYQPLAAAEVVEVVKFYLPSADRTHEALRSTRHPW